jgi:Fur family zinc uptake transcriptional regulator
MGSNQMQNNHPLTNWQAKARQMCAGAEVELTPKRLEVYTALLQAGHPLSAYELIDEVKHHFERQLTPISIYRMLEFLEQKHLVRKLKSAGKYIAITPNGPSANQQVLQFLICRECGEVKELGIDQRILVELKTCIDLSGFRLSNLELELDCVCTNCSTHTDADTGK